MCKNPKIKEYPFKEQKIICYASRTEPRCYRTDGKSCWRGNNNSVHAGYFKPTEYKNYTEAHKDPLKCLYQTEKYYNLHLTCLSVAL